jgi:hypothetical protein
MTDKIVCHSPSERCYGCDHYHGKADVCKYAPEMTDEKIKPVAWRTVDGRLFQQCDLAEHHADGVTQVSALYPESALAQAREEGRIEGLREAAEIVLNGRFLHDKAPTKLFANEAAAAITRAAEGKNPPKQVDPNKWAFDRGLESY